MAELKAVRKLVKSAPELWEICSDETLLARHLGAVDGITITRLEPKRAVCWQGRHACGTVQIQASGWGTEVTVTADSAQVLEPFLDSLGQAHRRPFSR